MRTTRLGLLRGAASGLGFLGYRFRIKGVCDSGFRRLMVLRVFAWRGFRVALGYNRAIYMGCVVIVIT